MAGTTGGDFRISDGQHIASFEQFNTLMRKGNHIQMLLLGIILQSLSCFCQSLGSHQDAPLKTLLQQPQQSADMILMGMGDQRRIKCGNLCAFNQRIIIAACSSDFNTDIKQQPGFRRADTNA